MKTWLTDANGNRCSVEYFGSREAAQAALDSLKNCRDCTNCSRCSDCTWHTCGTVHCRGGWVVHLAGEAGYALERFFGDTGLAAQLIYRESGAPINPCRFYDGNADALADMKHLAEEASVSA